MHKQKRSEDSSKLVDILVFGLVSSRKGAGNPQSNQAGAVQSQAGRLSTEQVQVSGEAVVIQRTEELELSRMSQGSSGHGRETAQEKVISKITTHKGTEEPKHTTTRC